MDVLSQIAGALIAAAGMYDVFHTIFHPTKSGTLSDQLVRAVWWVFRLLARLRTQLLSHAGPVAMLAVMIFWASSLAGGLALVYWRHLGDGDVTFAPGFDPAGHARFIDALNFSFGALISLDGGMTAKADWLRALSNAEAVAGFGLLTASVSWLLSIYPVLQRRKSLAHQVTVLHQADQQLGRRTVELDPQVAASVLGQLADELVVLRTDVEEFPITFYFREDQPRTSVVAALPYLRLLAGAAVEEGRAEVVRHAGLRLGAALHDLLRHLAENFLGGALPDEEVLARLARMFLHGPEDRLSGPRR